MWCTTERRTPVAAKAVPLGAPPFLGPAIAGIDNPRAKTLLSLLL